MSDKPYHHGDLRNAILTAARKALRHSDPDQLSLRQLARDAGVSANAPYRHFSDRASLLLALSLDGYRSLSAAVRARTQSGSLQERSTGFSDAYLEFAREEQGLFRLMFGPSTGQDSQELQDARQELFAEMVSALDQGGTAGDPEASIRQAVGVWVAVHGSTIFLLDGTLDWLDTWLRPGGAEIAGAMRHGFSRLHPGRGER